MTRSFVADIEQTVKRPLSDTEIAAIGKLISSVALLPLACCGLTSMNKSLSTGWMGTCGGGYPSAVTARVHSFITSLLTTQKIVSGPKRNALWSRP